MKNVLFKILLKIWQSTDGWKTVIGYILAQLPLFIDKPWILDAILKAISNPTAENIGAAIAHILLAFGLLHKIKKQFNIEDNT